MPLSRLPAGSIVLAFLAGASAALSNVIVVDKAGGAGVDFIELRDALAAAAPGDIVLVRTGTYFPGGGVPLWIDGKGVSVVVDTGASVSIGTDFFPIKNVPAGQWSVIQGPLDNAPDVSTSPGIVWIDRVVEPTDLIGPPYQALVGAAVQIDPVTPLDFPLGSIPPAGTLTLQFAVVPTGVEGHIAFRQAGCLKDGKLHLTGGQPVVVLSSAL